MKDIKLNDQGEKFSLESSMKILTICGSLRNSSSNAALLKALPSFFPNQTGWDHFEIKTLPYFDPQLQFSSELPQVVLHFRKQASQADFIVISTPEYAHGIPGILKNALEWLLCEETMSKKVLIFVGTSSGGEFVRPQLIETLRTMDMVSSEEMTFVIRGGRTYLAPEGRVLNQELQKELQDFVDRVLIL
jgi:NAD(P)H-dependent FMN reductase